MHWIMRFAIEFCVQLQRLERAAPSRVIVHQLVVVCLFAFA